MPNITLYTIYKIFLISTVMWLVWALSFYLLLVSVHSINIVPLEAGLIFPISSVMGIIVIISPGGLGVREGFLTLGLNALEIPAIDAASIAIISRIWFLIGEFMFFLLAILLQFINKRNKL